MAVDFDGFCICGKLFIIIIIIIMYVVVVFIIVIAVMRRHFSYARTAYTYKTHTEIRAASCQSLPIAAHTRWHYNNSNMQEQRPEQRHEELLFMPAFSHCVHLHVVAVFFFCSCSCSIAFVMRVFCV